MLALCARRAAAPPQPVNRQYVGVTGILAMRYILGAESSQYICTDRLRHYPTLLFCPDMPRVIEVIIICHITKVVLAQMKSARNEISCMPCKQNEIPLETGRLHQERRDADLRIPQGCSPVDHRAAMLWIVDIFSILWCRPDLHGNRKIVSASIIVPKNKLQQRSRANVKRMRLSLICGVECV